MDRQASGFLPVTVFDLLPAPSGVVHGGSAEGMLAACERFQALQAIRLAEIEAMPTEQALAALETLTEDVEAMLTAEGG